MKGKGRVEGNAWGLYCTDEMVKAKNTKQKTDKYASKPPKVCFLCLFFSISSRRSVDR